MYFDMIWTIIIINNFEYVLSCLDIHDVHIETT